jgi:YD repeat-containing protein
LRADGGPVIVERRGTARDSSRGSNYTYDAIYELTKVMQGANTTENYTYDPVGNRLTSLSGSYNNNSSNELTSSPTANFLYDYNGNTTSKTDSTGTTSYTWDFENRTPTRRWNFIQ